MEKKKRSKQLKKNHFILLLSVGYIVGDTILLKGIKYKITDRMHSISPDGYDYEVRLVPVISKPNSRILTLSMWSLIRLDEQELVERDFSYSLRFYTRFYQLILRKYLDEIRRSEVSNTTPIDMENASNILTSLQLILINENA